MLYAKPSVYISNIQIFLRPFSLPRHEINPEIFEKKKKIARETNHEKMGCRIFWGPSPNAHTQTEWS